MAKTEDKPTLSADHFSLYGSPGFYATYDLLDNEKAKTRFIQSIEQMIRSSFEYSNYIKYLKTEAKLVYCDILQGLDEESMKGITLEMHHYPFTLYDLTETILMKYLLNNKDFSRLSIANEVMDLHYSLKVGIIPLTLTMHQLAHQGSIIVDLDNIFGDYKTFMKEYKLFIPDSAITRVKMYESKSKNKELLKTNNRNTLELNPILFNLDWKPENTEIAEEESEPAAKPKWDAKTAYAEDSLGDF
jgi:hypothetical protein